MADQSSFLACVIGRPILALGLACFVVAATSPVALLGRVRVPGAATVAAIAYSTYLVHKQVFHLLVTAFGPLLRAHLEIAFLPCAIVALAAGALLYLAVERPFLRLRDRLTTVAAAPIAAIP